MSKSGRNTLPFLALPIDYYKVSPHSVVISIPPYLVFPVTNADTSPGTGFNGGTKLLMQCSLGSTSTKLQTYSCFEHRVQQLSGSTPVFSSQLFISVLKRARLVWKLPFTEEKHSVPQDPAERRRVRK